MLQEVAAPVVLADAQVDRDAPVSDRAGTRLATRLDACEQLKAAEGGGDRLRVRAGRDQVQVAARLRAAAHRARGDRLDVIQRQLERGDDFLRDFQRARGEHPRRQARALAAPLDRLEHRRLELRADALKRAQLLALGGCTQLLEAAIPSSV